jgi:hypothetical protein
MRRRTACRFFENRKTIKVLTGVLFFSFFLFGNNDSYAIPSHSALFSCFSRAIDRILGKSSHGLAQVPARDYVFKDLDDVLSAFSNGFVPDLSVPSQRQAFEFYRRLRFGDPNTDLKSNTTSRIAKSIQERADLTKEPFRNYIFKMEEKEYPVPTELAAFLNTQIESAGQVRSNIFQIEANSGYWKKALQFEPSQVQPLPKLARDASEEEKSHYRELVQKQKEMAQTQWRTLLDKSISPRLRKRLADTQIAPIDRATELFESLKTIRAELASQGKDVKPISQVMIDLIHTIGYHDPATTRALKSNDGLERINAYRKVLQDRDAFAMRLGYEGHFEQAYREIAQPSGILMPTGVPVAHGLSDKLQTLENGVLAGAKFKGNETKTRIVRHLSLVESPYRSCLGGSDCSSRTYLTRALDPNYHYFTITDPATGESSGHVTLVLGEAKHHEASVKTAFIDKIQNVPNRDLPVMVEAVRRSVEEKGYRLALPDDLGIGNLNGISNEEATGKFVKASIQTDSEQALLGFQPHPHDYRFPNTYSRAEDLLPMHAVLPASLPQDAILSPGEIQIPWKLSEKTKVIDLNGIIESSINLKNSKNISDRLRYIAAMKVLLKAKMRKDPEMGRTLDQWIQNNDESLQLRKQALLFRWIEESGSLSRLLSHFDASDRTQIVQNLIDTPRYRAELKSRKKDFSDVFTLAKENPTIRRSLARIYVPQGVDEKMASALDQIIAARDISHSQAIKILNFVKEGDEENFLLIHNIFSPLYVQQLNKLTRNTSVKSSLLNEMFQTLLLSNPDWLYKILMRWANHASNQEVEFDYFEFLRELLIQANRAHPTVFQNDAFLHGLADVFKLASSASSWSSWSKLEYAVPKWLSQSDVPIEAKVQFVKALQKYSDKYYGLAYRSLSNEVRRLVDQTK